MRSIQARKAETKHTGPETTEKERTGIYPHCTNDSFKNANSVCLMFDKVVKERILTCQEFLAFKLGDKEMSASETSNILTFLSMNIIRCFTIFIALC